MFWTKTRKSKKYVAFKLLWQVQFFKNLTHWSRCSLSISNSLNIVKKNITSQLNCVSAAQRNKWSENCNCKCIHSFSSLQITLWYYSVGTVVICTEHLMTSNARAVSIILPVPYSFKSLDDSPFFVLSFQFYHSWTGVLWSFPFPSGIQWRAVLEMRFSSTLSRCPIPLRLLGKNVSTLNLVCVCWEVPKYCHDSPKAPCVKYNSLWSLSIIRSQSKRTQLWSSLISYILKYFVNYTFAKIFWFICVQCVLLWF